MPGPRLGAEIMELIHARVLFSRTSKDRESDRATEVVPRKFGKVGTQRR